MICILKEWGKIKHRISGSDFVSKINIASWNIFQGGSKLRNELQKQESHGLEVRMSIQCMRGEQSKMRMANILTLPNAIGSDRQ